MSAVALLVQLSAAKKFNLIKNPIDLSPYGFFDAIEYFAIKTIIRNCTTKENRIIT